MSDPNTLNSLAEDLIFFGQEVLAQLKAELILVPKVRRDYRGAQSAPGAHVQIPLISVAGSATARVPGDPVTASAVSASSESLTLGQLYQAVSIDNLSRTFSNVDLANEAASRIAYSVAKAADAQIAALAPKAGNSCGTVDGTAFFNSTDDVDSLATARKLLVQSLAPWEPGKMYGVFGPEDSYSLRILDSYKRADKSGSAYGRQTGSLGNIEGFELFETQQIVNKSNDIAAWDTTALTVGSGTVGDTTVSLDGLAAATPTIHAGNRFTIAGDSQVYMVTADVAVASNAAVVSIAPALKVAFSTSAVVTPKADTTAAMNMIFNGDGILAVSRPQAPFLGAGITSVSVADEQTGLSIRLSHESKLLDATHGMQDAIVADILFGAKVIRPEYMVAGFGKA